MAHLTTTASGEIANFYSFKEAPIKSLKVYFEPKQVGEGDPSPENVREIEGWDNVSVWHAGKNLMSENHLLSPAQIGASEEGHVIKAANVFKIFSVDIPKNTELHLSKNINAGSELGIGTEIAEIGLPIIRIGSMTNYKNRTFNSGNNQYAYVMMYRTTPMTDPALSWQLEIGNKKTSYEYPKPVTECTVSFPKKIYGGWVDLISGEICEEWKTIDLGDCDWIHYGHRDSVFYTRSLNSLKVWTSPGTVISTHYRYEGAPNVTAMNELTISDSEQLNRGNVNICDPNYSGYTSAEFKEAMRGVMCAYKASNTTTYHIDPTQLAIFLGQNNIWSNATRVEVEYELAESPDIIKRTKQIALSAPHIVTTTGDVITFNTDTSAPLKDGKVCFLPVQRGTGTPSVDNVMPITGWRDITITHTGENIWDEQWEVGYLNTTTGGNAAAANQIRSKNYIPVKPNVNYFFHSSNSGVGMWCAFFDKDKNIITDFTTPSNASRSANVINLNCKSYRVPADCCYLRFYMTAAYGDTYKNDISITNGTTDIGYAAYSGEQYYFDWSDNAGEIYGGTINPVTGQLFETWKRILVPHSGLKGTDFGSQYDGENGTHRYFVISDKSKGGDPALISDKLKFASCYEDVAEARCQYDGTGLLHIRLPNSTINVSTEMSSEERTIAMQTWLENNDIYICYPLNQPALVYAFEERKILTDSHNINNISATTNDFIAAKYWTHNKLINTSPEIELYGYKNPPGNPSKLDLLVDGNAVMTKRYTFPMATKTLTMVAMNLIGNITVWQNGVYKDYWGWTSRDTQVVRNVINATTNEIQFGIYADRLDDCYAYIKETGQVFFAGKNTQYYGRTNIYE